MHNYVLALLALYALLALIAWIESIIELLYLPHLHLQMSTSLSLEDWPAWVSVLFAAACAAVGMCLRHGSMILRRDGKALQ